jgi:plasmid stability protein
MSHELNGIVDAGVTLNDEKKEAARHRLHMAEREWNRRPTFSNSFQYVDMRPTCLYVFHMPTMIQIRNVPDALHRRLKARAALAGMSLSDYLLSEIREVAERPTLEELRARLERRSSVMPSITPVDAIRTERDRQ